ncbi:hypothetical protein HELRODRAFT_179908 [Helobdella robusta]|uniref:Uncharacterized protein n=1 Tax=Helobdella robusta TaxID=6412 RepID=T1FF88_HELRO|nr:hypothetical protein HELRODRAFT_179908 [Helobdella robusta]ESN95048.1 hypothetical protein HELRODRAFT_179908 [Helobdella robusta]
MDDDQLEKSNKALTLAQVALNPCINKRLYFKNLVSTLREPLNPKIVRKRKVAGLDCDLSEEEFIEKRKKWQSKKLVTGKDYDPDTDYIYDARKYYDPEKEQEAIEYRNKREAFLKMKQQKQEELQQQQQIQPPYLATNFKTQSDFFLASKPYLRNQGFAYRGGRFRGVHPFGGRFKRQRGFMPQMMGYYAGGRDGSYQNYESPYPAGLEYNSSNDAWLCGGDMNEPRCYSDVGGGENEDGVGYHRVGSSYRQDVPDEDGGGGGGSGGGGSRERKKKVKKLSKKKSKKKHHHRKSDSKKRYNSDDGDDYDDGDDGRDPLLRGEDDVTDDADEDDEEEINLRQLRRELERKKLQLKQIFLKNSHSDGGGEENEDERALKSNDPDLSTSSQHHHPRRHLHRKSPSELHTRSNSSDSYGTPETSPSEQRPADHKSASSDYKKHRHKPSKSPSLISSSSSSSRKSSAAAAAVPVEVDEKHASGWRLASSRDKMRKRKRKMTQKDKKMARNSSTNNNSFSEISSDDGRSSCERANRRNFNENKLNPPLADDNNDDEKCDDDDGNGGDAKNADDDDDEIKLLNEGKKLAEVIKRTEELLYGLGNCTSFTKIKQYARSYFLKTNIDEQLKVFLSRHIERSCSEVAYHSSSYIESQAASASSAARSKDDIDVGTLENPHHQRHSGRPGGNFTKKYKINQVIKSRSGQNSNSSSRKSSPDVRKSRSHRRSRDTSQSNGSSIHSDDEDDDDEEDDDQSKHETSHKSTAKKSTSTPYATDDVKRKRKTQQQQQQQSSADQSESSSSDESNSKNYHPPQRKENHSRTLNKYINDHATGRKFENLQIRVTNSALMQASKTNNNNNGNTRYNNNNSFCYGDAGDQVNKPPPITRPHLLPDPAPYYLRGGGGGSGSFVGSGRSSNDGFYKFNDKVLEYEIGNNNSGERYFNPYRGAYYDGRRKFERADAIVSFKNSNYKNAIYEGNEFELADDEQHFSSSYKLLGRHNSSTFYADVECDHADHYKQHYRAATSSREHRKERTPTDHYPTSHRNYKNYSLTTTTTTYPTSNEKNKLETLLSKNSMVADQLSPPPSSATNCSGSSSRKSIYERLGRKLGDDVSWNSRRPQVMKMPGPTNNATSSTFITPEYQNKYRTTRDEPLLPQFSRNLNRHDNLMRRYETYQQHQHVQHRPNFKPYITNYAASSGFGAGSSRSSSSSNQPTKKFIHPLVHSSSSSFASSSSHFKRNLLSSSSSSPTTSSLASSVRLPKASKSLQSAVSLVKR